MVCDLYYSKFFMDCLTVLNSWCRMRNWSIDIRMGGYSEEGCTVTMGWCTSLHWELETTKSTLHFMACSCTCIEESSVSNWFCNGIWGTWNVVKIGKITRWNENVTNSEVFWSSNIVQVSPGEYDSFCRLIRHFLWANPIVGAHYWAHFHPPRNEKHSKI